MTKTSAGVRKPSFLWQLLFNSIIFIGLTTILSACGQVNSHRENERQQNQADVTAELKDLAIAEGSYTGTITMKADGREYDAQIILTRVFENVHPGSSQDPTQTINLPKLSGNLTFAVLKNTTYAQYSQYPALIQPMGGFALLAFSYGDYDPESKRMTLPYNVSGYSNGNFGELFGKFQNGEFTGKWFCQPLGLVGDFAFSKDSDPNSQKGGLN
jgi:hypothetical protein